MHGAFQMKDQGHHVVEFFQSDVGNNVAVFHTRILKMIKELFSQFKPIVVEPGLKSDILDLITLLPIGHTCSKWSANLQIKIILASKSMKTFFSWV